MKKYLHILNQTASSFTTQLIYMINHKLELDNYNTFVTHEKHILSLNENDWGKNIIYSDDLVKIINEECMNYDYFFIHAMNFGLIELLRIKTNAKKKFIWLTWGHDIYSYNNNKIITALRFVYLRLKGLLLRNIYGFGYGFDYDEIQAHKLLPRSVKAFNIPYGYEEGIEKSFDELLVKKTNKKTINVLIGHCGMEFINHIKIMNEIKKIYNKNVIINMVLSYGGSDEYTKKVREYAYNNFDKENVFILEERLSKKDYLKYLSNMDIAIFDYKQSSGLDNIFMLLYCGKKLYLNDKGVLYKGISAKGIPVYKTSDISKSYEEFERLLSDDEIDECRKYAKTHTSDIEIMKLWKDFFDNN